MLSNQMKVKEIKQFKAPSWFFDQPSITREGWATVAKGRDGPFTLHYQIYGQGLVKILWLSGHGAGLEDFYGYMKHFGLDESGQYTSMLLENRGIGQSQGPWSFCSMSDLATDTLEVLDEVGWQDECSVHIVGHSMGGMMALRMAVMDPARIASLTLVSTTSDWMKATDFLSMSRNTLATLIPKSEDTRMNENKVMLFGETWLMAPDERGVFPTNGDAWAAQSLRLTVPYKGGIIQAPAAIRHRLTPDEMRSVLKSVGASHIQILHGGVDHLLPRPTADHILAGFGGPECNVQLHIFDQAGHMVPTEQFEDVVRLMKAFVKT